MSVLWVFLETIYTIHVIQNVSEQLIEVMSFDGGLERARVYWIYKFKN